MKFLVGAYLRQTQVKRRLKTLTYFKRNEREHGAVCARGGSAECAPVVLETAASPGSCQDFNRGSNLDLLQRYTTSHNITQHHTTSHNITQHHTTSEANYNVLNIETFQQSKEIDSMTKALSPLVKVNNLFLYILENIIQFINLIIYLLFS